VLRPPSSLLPPSSWELGVDEIERYRAIFESFDSVRACGALGAMEAKQYFERSGLEGHDLSSIWKLSNVHQEGMLQLDEFVCAMHLSASRLQGIPLPTELPQELSASLREHAACIDSSRYILASDSAVPSGMTSPYVGYAGAGARAPSLPGSPVSQNRAEPLREHSGSPPSDPGIGVMIATASSTWPPSPSLVEEPSIERITPEAHSRFHAIFHKLDSQGAGVIGPAEAVPILEKSNLSREELSVIWRLSDVAGNNLLTEAQFVVAMHLAERRRHGSPLPLELPPELAELAAEPAVHSPSSSAFFSAAPQDAFGSVRGRSHDSPYSISSGQLEVYRRVFDAIDPQGQGTAGGLETLQVLQRANLPQAEYTQIGQLARLPHNVFHSDHQCLSFGEFACVMHLTSLRRDGATLPSDLPGELDALLTPMSPQLSPQASPHSSPQLAGHGDGFSGTLGGNIHDITESPWVLAPADIERYTTLFSENGDSESGLISAQQVKDLLMKSHLPEEDLHIIWDLSSVRRDNSGNMDLAEFVCAMHLTQGRRDGLVLPRELPGELVAALAALPGTSTPGSPIDSSLQNAVPEFQGDERRPPSSPWVVSSDEVDGYHDIFLRHGGVDMGLDEVRAVLERSGLPPHELEHVWRLVGLHEDGQPLSFSLFLCAMHLVSKRRMGAPLPSEMPAELTAAVACSEFPPMASAPAMF